MDGRTDERTEIGNKRRKEERKKKDRQTKDRK